MTDNPEPWHLKKEIPVALIFALCIQTAGAIWWASGINNRVEVNETSIVRLQQQGDQMRALSQTQAVQLGRIEEQIGALRGDIGRLLAIIERQNR
jgi:TolA-binding protein